MDHKQVPEGWDKTRALKEGVRLNVKKLGTGHPILMFHGGMGSWTHWVRNIQPIAEYFEVRAIDAPSYGKSERVNYALTPAEYLQVVIASVGHLIVRDESFSIVGFSFGAALGSAVAAHFGDRLRAITVIGPGGFSIEGRPRLNFIRYSDVKNDPHAYRNALRHNLLQLMLKHPESIDEDVLNMQKQNVEQASFNSRNVSALPILPQNLGKAGCRVQLIYGQDDVTAFPSIETRAEMIRTYVPNLKLHVLPNVGHWAMFEGAAEVNKLIIDFHKQI